LTDEELAEHASRVIDIPAKWYKDGDRTHEYSYEATARWEVAGIEYGVYSAGSTGNMFIFPTAADRERASALCADLWERMKQDDEIDNADLPELAAPETPPQP
jgi:hypothetical protein